MLIAADFGELNPPAVLVFTNNQQRSCASVAIIDDDIVEGSETFGVSLSSTNFQVDILSSNAPVSIADNEGKITRIKFDVKSHLLYHAYRGSVRIHTKHVHWFGG